MTVEKKVMLLFSTFQKNNRPPAPQVSFSLPEQALLCFPYLTRKQQWKKPISKGSTSLPERFPKESSPSSQLLQLLQKKA